MTIATPVFSFENFDLRIEPAGNGMVRAVVHASPAGTPYGTPFVVAPFPSTTDIFLSDDPTLPTTFGRTLFDTIFRGQILEAFNQSKQLAADKGKALRIRLRLHTVPTLARLPWELLTPPGQNPLVLSKHTPLVRYLDLLGTPKPLTINLPLRVLVVIAAPPSMPFLNGDMEWLALQQALAPLQKEGLVTLERLEGGSVTALRRGLSSDTPFHVLHFIGHSRFNEDLGEGELLLEPESDSSEQDEVSLSARIFTQMVAEHRTTHSDDARSFRLVYLSSCQGSVAQAVQATGSVAQTLVEQGMPAVIAMQGSLPGRDGVALASHFYRAIADGNPVDAALSIARQTFYTERSGSLSWALPTLFLRADNSYLFALSGQVIPDGVGAVVPPAPGAPPYKGLAYYDLGDHGRFFGREKLTRDLVEHLRTSPILMVVGASGSGKSSVVRAGVLAALVGTSTVVASSHLPRLPETWVYCVLTPTTTPLTSLATALTQDERSVLAAAQLQSDLEESVAALDFYLKRSTAGNTAARFLLVIDQLEELLTQCKSPQAQKRFLDVLFYALEHQAPLTIILTLRADFYDKFTSFPEVTQAFEQHQRVVVAMTERELRRAIELPAAQGKWEFEQGLVELFLADAGNEPGNLPLLSHALHETWLRRSGRTLTFAGYVAAGRIQGAIAHTADTVYAGLAPEDRTLARKIFMELTEPGDGTQDTRRRVALRDLHTLHSTPDTIAALLNTLAGARLVTLGQATAEVSHEALIREWSTLQAWINDNRTWLVKHRQLKKDAARWNDHQREDSYLHKGTELAQTAADVEGHQQELNALECEFLEASRVANEAEARHKRQSEERQQLSRRRGFIALVLAALLLGAVSFGFIANQQRAAAVAARATATVAQGTAEQSRIEAQSLRLVAESIALHTAQNSELALLTAAEAARYPLDHGAAVPPEAVQQLHTILSQEGGLPLRPGSGAITALAFSPDGAMVAAGTFQSAIFLWQVHDPDASPDILEGHTAPITALAFSPDGKWLATASDDRTARLWNLTTPGHEFFVLTGHTSAVTELSFSPDGTYLATGSKDATVNVWQVEAPIAGPRTLAGHTSYITGLAFSPDSALIATGDLDATVKVWTVAEPAPEPVTLTGPTEAITEIAFSPDGLWLAVGSRDSTTTLWRTTALNQPPQRLLYHTDTVLTLAFSPDSRWLATGSLDTLVNLYDLRNPVPEPPITYSGHAKLVSGVAFSSDSQWLVTASYDGSVKLWKVQEPLPGSPMIAMEVDGSGAPPRYTGSLLQYEVTLGRHADAISTVAFSPDGMWFASGSWDETVKLWKWQQPSPATLLLDNTAAPIAAVAFAPDSQSIAVTTHDDRSTLLLLEDGTLSPVSDVADTASSHAVQFSPDGQWFATGGTDGVVRVWKRDTPAEPPVQIPVSPNTIHTLEFSPNGHWLVVADETPRITVWDTATYGRDAAYPAQSLMAASTFAVSADSQWLATDNDAGQVRLWNLNALQENPVSLQSFPARVRALAFSPDGHWLAAAGDDTTVLLWTLSDLSAAPVRLTGHSSVVVSLAFSPDSAFLATGSWDTSTKLWDLTAVSMTPISLSGTSRVTHVAFSPDGTWLAAAYENSGNPADNTVRLWAYQRQFPQPFSLDVHDTVTTIAFSPDGAWLATASTETPGRLWLLSIETLVATACKAAGRNMTEVEWSTYFLEEPYRPSCPL